MKVHVCVGSSCHLKGSYNVIEAFKKEIETRGIDDKVQLFAAFCLGHCRDGVTIKIDEEIHTGLNGENASSKFQELVLSKLEA